MTIKIKSRLQFLILVNLNPLVQIQVNNLKFIIKINLNHQDHIQINKQNLIINIKFLHQGNKFKFLVHHKRIIKFYWFHLQVTTIRVNNSILTNLDLQVRSVQNKNWKKWIKETIIGNFSHIFLLRIKNPNNNNKMQFLSKQN